MIPTLEVKVIYTPNAYSLPSSIYIYAAGSDFTPDSKVVLLTLLPNRWDHNQAKGTSYGKRSAPSGCLWEAIPTPAVSMNERQSR